MKKGRKEGRKEGGREGGGDRRRGRGIGRVRKQEMIINELLFLFIRYIHNNKIKEIASDAFKELGALERL